MNVLWTSKMAQQATGGDCGCDWQASGISIDTRSLEEGDLFVALKDTRDGHDFVAQALKKGAAAALVSHIPTGVPPEAPLLIVPDVLDALRALAQAARARTRAKVIGVTGSVGKTGTKEMLRLALAGQGRVHAAERSFNNHWGVPLTLARMPQETDFAIIEIGMNHPGEITPLARLADLDVAVVTTVAAVHMLAFKDVAEIAQAKAEIFDGLRRGGVAVLNGDIDTLPILTKAAGKAKAQIVTFGEANVVDLHLDRLSLTPEGTSVKASLDGQKILFRIGAPGKHLAMNALAVLAAVRAADGDIAKAMLALADWHAPTGRGERFTIELAHDTGLSLELVDESYNANPTSVAAALEVLALSEPTHNVGRIRQGRRIAFLGDMLELGPQEQSFHAKLADLSAIENIDLVHTAGPLMQALHAALPIEKRGVCCETSEQLRDQMYQLLDAGDVVMVKGSLGSKMALVVRAIKALGETGAT